MAVTTTTRLGIYRWDSDTDPFNRAQMDISHANLEATVAQYSRGSTLPEASPKWERSFFFRTTDNALYYFKGVDQFGEWVKINNFYLDDPDITTDVAYGGVSSDGTSEFAARADHVHAMEDLQLENYILKATVDTKGDLIAATGNSTVQKLAAGPNGQVLVTDSTTTTGLKWATAVTAQTTTNLTGVIFGNGAVISASTTLDGGTA